MTQVRIDVRSAPSDAALTFTVIVNERDTQSRHVVTISPAYAARFREPAEQVIEAAFRFLLDRERKESILSRFDIAVIAKYFPEFPQELPHYLARS